MQHQGAKTKTKSVSFWPNIKFWRLRRSNLHQPFGADTSVPPNLVIGFKEVKSKHNTKISVKVFNLAPLCFVPHKAFHDF
jgi:hypothetical protein